MGQCKIVEAHHPTYNAEMQTSKGVKHVWWVRDHLKRSPNHSELVDVDLENKKEVPVTMGFVDTYQMKTRMRKCVYQQKEVIFIIVVICLTFN